MTRRNVLTEQVGLIRHILSGAPYHQFDVDTISMFKEESETAKEIRSLMDHLLTKITQCGENKRDRDAYNKLLEAYSILMSD